MNLDNRYEGFLADILTLLEEFTVRHILKKQIDLDKFKHFFNKFYDRLTKLEQQFHQNRLKFSKYLLRLKENCDYGGNSSRSFDGLKANNPHNVADQPIFKPFVRSISTAKPSQVSKELKAIEEEDDEYRTPVNNRRSQTADGYRNKAYRTISRDHCRPKTGKDTGRNRYSESNKMAKTINVTEHPSFNTEQSESYKQFSRSRDNTRIQYTFDQKQILDRRKDFYAELQLQKSKDGDVFSEKQSNQIFKKYKGKANKRLWQKINRLI